MSEPAASVARHLALVGPTASGKSALAMALARGLGDVELVSVDSMQVYRGMDVGTAKPSAAERAEVPHHLLDLVEPTEEFTVSRFQSEARRAIATIEGRGHRALLVGGTGLYLRAVVDDLAIPGRWPEVRAELDANPDTAALHERLAALDPVGAGRMEPTNRRRVVRALEVTVGSGRPFSSFGPGVDAYPRTRFDLLGVWLPRRLLDERIERRYAEQLAAGFLAEVRRLVEAPEPLGPTAAQALGYAELAAHLAGTLTLDEAVARAVQRTRRFARRQERWFQRDPRIGWVGHAGDPLAALPMVVRAAGRPGRAGRRRRADFASSR